MGAMVMLPPVVDVMGYGVQTSYAIIILKSSYRKEPSMAESAKNVGTRKGLLSRTVKKLVEVAFPVAMFSLHILSLA